MNEDRKPAGSEPWTGYHAGMPAPPPAQPEGGGPHRARGWIALLVGMLVSLALVGTLLAFNGGPQTAALPTLPSTGALVPTSPSGPAASTVGTIVDINTSQQVLGADGLRPLGAG